MTVFYCTSESGKVNDKPWVYIEAERWFDARKVAYILFGTDQVKFETLPDHGAKELKLEEEHHQGNFYTAKWVGSPMDPRNQPTLKAIQWKNPNLPSDSSEPESSSSPSPSGSSGSLPESTEEKESEEEETSGPAPKNFLLSGGSSAKAPDSSSTPSVETEEPSPGRVKKRRDRSVAR